VPRFEELLIRHALGLLGICALSMVSLLDQINLWHPRIKRGGRPSHSIRENRSPGDFAKRPFESRLSRDCTGQQELWSTADSADGPPRKCVEDIEEATLYRVPSLRRAFSR